VLVRTERYSCSFQRVISYGSFHQVYGTGSLPAFNQPLSRTVSCMCSDVEKVTKIVIQIINRTTVEMVLKDTVK